jgi:hypothetical protein
MTGPMYDGPYDYAREMDDALNDPAYLLTGPEPPTAEDVLGLEDRPHRHTVEEHDAD